jgi:hypothetical protein
MRNQFEFQRIDQVMRGEFATTLRQMRAERQSYLSMSGALRRYGVMVNPETLRGWCAELGIEKPYEVSVSCITRPED